MSDLTAGGVPVYRDSTGVVREVPRFPNGATNMMASAPIGFEQLDSEALATATPLMDIPANAVRAIAQANGGSHRCCAPGAPTNCTLQDAYVSVAGTISVGALVPAVGIGATVACPLALYKVN